MTAQVKRHNMMAIAASLPMIAQMAAIFFFGLRPMPEEVVRHPDWLLHGICYAVLTGFAWIAVTARYPGIARRKALALAFMISTVYGVFDEWHQRFLPHRDASMMDIAADAIGALIAVALLFLILNSGLISREKKINE